MERRKSVVDPEVQELYDGYHADSMARVRANIGVLMTGAGHEIAQAGLGDLTVEEIKALWRWLTGQ